MEISEVVGEGGDADNSFGKKELLVDFEFKDFMFTNPKKRKLEHFEEDLETAKT